MGAIFTKHWNAYLDLFQDEKKDIYFTEEYVKLYETGEDTAECFIYIEGKEIFLFPYLKREILLISGGYSDFETAYGYGGPLVNTDNAQFINRAIDDFDSSLREKKIIAGLVRFHPILANYHLFGTKYNIVYDRNTFAMDLTQDEDAIWKEQIHPKHRNVIVKARKAGGAYYADESLKYLDTFKEIYRSSMNRLGADCFYMFEDSYFDKIKKGLNKHVFLGVVLVDSIVIAGALFLYYGHYGHYHLAASLEGFKQYCPNNLLIHETALYLKQNGLKLFHLGGGSDRSPNNTLCRFKKRFSKVEYPHFIGKLVFAEDKYKQVCDVWEKSCPEKREKYKDLILKYRY